MQKSENGFGAAADYWSSLRIEYGGKESLHFLTWNQSGTDERLQQESRSLIGRGRSRYPMYLESSSRCPSLVVQDLTARCLSLAFFVYTTAFEKY